jgi:type VI secretion system protein ImpA
MPTDVEGLLAEIDPESPCGEDLTYDAGYLELERAAQGTPEQQVGETVVHAEEPNWREVRGQAIELLGRTKELRLVLYLALSLLKLEGVPGLRDGLAVLRGVLERYWDNVHPQLDAEDDYDPLERINIIASLSPPPDTYGDPMMFLQRLREAPLCDSKQLGKYSLRDILIARGDITPADSDEHPAELPVIEGAFQDTDVEALQATAAAAAEAQEHMAIIDSVLTQYVGVNRVPNLGELQGMLKEIRAVVEDFLARRGEGTGAGAAGEVAPAPGGAPAGPALSGEIRSPEDVIRALDKICDYYRRYEPSSPVPLLVTRAKRLVRKDFMEIIQDLNPDGLRQIEIIGGPQGEGTG